MRIYKECVQLMHLQANISAFLFDLSHTWRFFHHILHQIAVRLHIISHADIPRNPSIFGLGLHANHLIHGVKSIGFTPFARSIIWHNDYFLPANWRSFSIYCLRASKHTQVFNTSINGMYPHDKGACTCTTKHLYWHHKQLVPARQDVCSVTTKMLVASLQMVFTDTLTAKTRQTNTIPRAILPAYNNADTAFQN